MAELPGLLAGDGWCLVEFWCPDNLFSRLLAPVRAHLAADRPARLRLLCCVVAGPDADCAAWGATALPALVLFQGVRRVRRWLGAVEVSLLLHGIDRAMGDPAP